MERGSFRSVIAQRCDSSPAPPSVSICLSAIHHRKSLNKKIIVEPSPEIAMEPVVAKIQSEVEVTDQFDRVELLQELTSLQLAMVGGGLGTATLI